MNDMVIKSKEQEKQTTHLESIFREVTKYMMQLNSRKCIFRVRYKKFLGNNLTERGIKVNLVKDTIKVDDTFHLRF